MAIADLNQQQEVALLAETISTRNLLAYGVRVVRTGMFIDTTRDPILTMLSIGVEKLFKLTLGLVALDRDHEWPAKDEMREHGHKLVVMYESVRTELRARTTNGTQYVRGVLAKVDEDTLIEPIIEALDMYGRMGRFYYLDRLGNAPQKVSPEEAWQKIEEAALADPNVAVSYRRVLDDVGNNDVWDGFMSVLNHRIAVAVETLWIAIAVCGRNRVLGEAGTRFGFEVHPEAVGRP